MADDKSIKFTSQKRDLTGMRFSRLVVIEPRGLDKHRKRSWLCRCDCGSFCTPNSSALTSGNSTSCGCFKRENTSARSKTHGMTTTPAYNAWVSMRRRCAPGSANAKDYYQRGITVCEEWQHSFESFFSNIGPRPKGTTLERIDNNLGYCPGNVRWATWEDQASNRRTVRLVTHNGKAQTIAKWARETGISQRIISQRLVRGMSPERALSATILRKKAFSSNMIRLKKIWYGIIQRCTNANNEQYGNYGGRGISVCKSWMKSFNQFASDIGPRPSLKHSIDRIDNDGDYCPGNCRWETNDQQQQHTSRSRYITHDNITLTISKWSTATGLPQHVIRQRMSRGWDTHRVLSHPYKKKPTG